jgi:aldehyde:ferredoxin oxidoreductase
MADKLCGYVGKILRVDLTTGQVTEEPSSRYLPKYIGGRGLGARIYWDEIMPETEPLSPENKLIFTSGPLTGTGALGASRSGLVTKAAKGYPKKTYHVATSGMGFGNELKYAGYDALIVQGASPKPVYLWIEDGHVEIRDAGALWGLITKDTLEQLRRTHGDNIRTAIIGPAGENLVVHAIIMIDWGSGFSMGGVGAVQGSKKLKAIAVHGTGRINIADPKALLTIMDRLKDWKTIKLGVTKTFDGKEVTGVRETRWYRTFPAEEAAGKITRGIRSCGTCDYNCRNELTFNDNSGFTIADQCAGEFEYMNAAEKYYSSLTDRRKASLEVTNLCEQLGLDLHVIGNTPWIKGEPWSVKYAAYDISILTKENSGLPWDKLGSIEFAQEYLMSMTYKQGFGAHLAEDDALTVKYLIEHEEYGDSRDYLWDVYQRTYAKNSDFSGIDSHALLLYVDTDESPIRALIMHVDVKNGREPEPHWGKVPEPIRAKWLGVANAIRKYYYGPEVAQAAIRHEQVGMESDSLIICDWVGGKNAWFQVRDMQGRPLPSIEKAPDTPNMGADYWNAVTGITKTQEELYENYDMLRNLERAILVREGYRSKDEQFFDWYHEIRDETGRLVCPKDDFNKLKLEYYRQRGWDPVTGIPSKATLIAKGLQDVAEELERRRVPLS